MARAGRGNPEHLKGIRFDVAELAYDHDQVGVVRAAGITPSVDFDPHTLKRVLDGIRTGGIDDVKQTVGKEADLVGQRVRPRHDDQPEIFGRAPARQCRDQCT